MNQLEKLQSHIDKRSCILGIVGLGYVGLPLAVEFGKQYQTLGFDINKLRIEELQAGKDSTKEVDSLGMQAATQLYYSSAVEELEKCNVLVVAVPTPIDKYKRPDLRPLEGASRLVGQSLGKGSVIVFESTVYPGATEEICVPILEKESGLIFNEDFFVGYSPERINPGDKEHRLTNIVKVTSGSTSQAAQLVDKLYASIITAGTYLASSIRVAEAAKVIENTQRDVNIALVNELALIFDRLGIDTMEVLEAAGTKWNFLPFRPGLVGGHCIGVDPYYLTHKAQETGYNPEMILAGRRLNDNMSSYIVSRVVKLMLKKRIHINGANILIMGLTFKENCPDVRNTKVIDIIHEFQSYGADVDVHDPWVDGFETKEVYGIDPVEAPIPGKYDAIVLCVAHREFSEKGAKQIKAYGKVDSVLFDVKHVLSSDDVDGRL